MSTIRILHISDLQFGKKNRYNNPTLLSNIETFAKSIADEVEMSLDMIIVTGDIAHSASREEYNDALKFFDRISNEFKIYGKQPEIYIVPGNHDIERDKTGLGNDKKQFEDKFFNYNFFIQSLLKSNDLCTKYDHPYYVSKACDNKISIIGLNSAINITKSDNHGQISLKQINNAIQEIEKNSETFKIAIVHHNFTRNSDNDETNIRDADELQHILIDAKIQLLLHGHQHLAGAELRRNLVNGNQIFILSTGSTSLKPPRLDIEIQNQFQLITLELEPTIKVSVDRKVFAVQPNRPGIWIPDGSEAKDGKFHFFIYPKNIQKVIEAIQEIHDCQICSKTSSIHFSNGFETDELYKKLLKNTKFRLWIFGRKNRKLFETGVGKALDEFLQRKKMEKSLNFEVLFLSPHAPENIISNAHADSIKFKKRLEESIERARETCEKNDIKFDKICKFYQKERCIATIIIDNAVLFKKIKTDQYGRVERLSDTSFDIVSADSVIGKDLVNHFEETWKNGTLDLEPLKYDMDVLKGANEIGIEDIFSRRNEKCKEGMERYQNDIRRAICDQFKKNSGKIIIYCVAAREFFDNSRSEIADIISKNLENPENKCVLEVLILCPKSNAANIRKGLEPHHELINDIKYSLGKLRNLHKINPNKVKFKLYDLIPSVFLIITDDVAFVETYPMHIVEGNGSLGGRLPMLLIRKTTCEGVEFEAYRRWKAHFDYAWNNFSHDDKKQCTLEYELL